MDCIKQDCGEELFPIQGLCSEPEGIREDQYCANCNTRYSLHKSGLNIISENSSHADVAIRNRELETTLKVMIELKNK